LLLDVYDQHLARLTSIATSVCTVFCQGGIEYRVVGGLAVLFHVQLRDPMAARVTRDVDLAIRRTDLPRIIQAVRILGLEHEHIAGVDMLVYTGGLNRRGVHLLFAGEKYGLRI
jgi:hypothetical protein